MDPDDAALKSLVPAAYAEERDGIYDVLIEAYAGHSPTSDRNAEVHAFLEAVWVR